MIQREIFTSHLHNPKAFWRRHSSLTSMLMHMRWKGEDIQVTWRMTELDKSGTIYMDVINLVPEADAIERKMGSQSWLERGRGRGRGIETETEGERKRRNRDGDRGRSSRQRRSDDLDDDVHAYHRRKRHCETEIERDSTADLLKVVETESEKPKRDEVEQDDYKEKIAFQLAQQEEEEEEEIDRIKEESRRRRQAIHEKYKNQLSQMELVTQSGDNELFVI